MLKFKKLNAFVLFFLLISIPSCNTQSQTQLPEESKNEYKTILTEQVKKSDKNLKHPDYGESDIVTCGLLDRNGNLWFGTVEGLYQYIGGSKDTAQNNPPSFFINDVQIFYESIDSTVYSAFFKNGFFTDYLTLPHDQNHIGFSFNKR